jgi:hypothetical protein
MTRCRKCNNGINSTYIREGEKGLWKKIGYYCPVCDIYYDMKKSKLYIKCIKKEKGSSTKGLMLNAI